MSAAYYNEHDPLAAAWLRELIAQGHIAPGDVDERDIRDVRPDELAGYAQCHFFAGIGVWSHALRQAGVSDDRPLWTASCPCQPFSQAGKGEGFADERHLWPALYHLIGQCRPGVVLGEQVASKDGLAWLDLVQTDMEAAGFAFGAVDLCAAGFGAPHIRQRAFWVAHTDDAGLEGRRLLSQRSHQRASGADVVAGRVADTDGRQPRHGQLQRGREHRFVAANGRSLRSRDSGTQAGPAGRMARAGAVDGFWRDADWLGCRDGRWRPVEPGTFPLADGAPARVGRLRGYGNAIVAPVAAAFIQEALSVIDANKRMAA